VHQNKGFSNPRSDYRFRTLATKKVKIKRSLNRTEILETVKKVGTRNKVGSRSKRGNIRRDYEVVINLR
jgi:hypothetical protein